MATRSDIIVERADGKWHRIYCHWDGYLAHNGKILFENYNGQVLAEKLVKKGNISSLGQKWSKPKGHSFDKPIKGYTVYYGRDQKGEKGEKDKGTFGNSLTEVWPNGDTWTEFTYVWKAKEGQWYVADADSGSQALVLLKDALSGAEIVTPAIKVFGVACGTHSPVLKEF